VWGSAAIHALLVASCISNKNFKLNPSVMGVSHLTVTCVINTIYQMHTIWRTREVRHNISYIPVSVACEVFSFEPSV